MKRPLLRCLISMGIGGILLGAAPTAVGQIVQLPTQRTFSISGGTLVPDRGTASLGGSNYSASGGRRAPTATGSGSIKGSSSVSISATIIDLDELDQMIRSQACSTPMAPSFAHGPSKVTTSPLSSKAKPNPPPAYAYLMAMSHTPEKEKCVVEDAKRYLDLAESARKRQQWGSVEHFYVQAWKSLPADRRETALAALMATREKHVPKDDDKDSNVGKPTRAY